MQIHAATLIERQALRDYHVGAAASHGSVLGHTPPSGDSSITHHTPSLWFAGNICFFFSSLRSHRWRLSSWHSGQRQDAPDNRTHSHAHTLRNLGHSWVLLEISTIADNRSHSSYARCAQAQQGYIALVTAHRWLCPSARHHLAFNRSHIPLTCPTSSSHLVSS